MKYLNSIIETIGDTPLVKLNSVTDGVKGTILAKVEYFNPGNSMKDRMAIKMIEDAEARGDLKPGGTIIEGTSGNTGMGLALGAIAKGYRCIFTLADKQSREKIDILRAVGAAGALKALRQVRGEVLQHGAHQCLARRKQPIDERCG